MKIGIISDSHHDLKSIDDAIFLAQDVDCWFHAGDSIDDAEYLQQVSDRVVYSVCGNIDWFSKKSRELLVKLGNINIFLTHGDAYNVKWGLKYLNERAESLKADVIIYGHSHVGAKNIIEKRLFLNPGSVSQPRDGLSPSFMIATIEKVNFADIEENEEIKINVIEDIALERVFLKETV